MPMSRALRAFTAWALYGCVLFSLFACGIAHGRMSGLTLSGLQGGFCLSASDQAGTGMKGLTNQSLPQPVSKIDCPMCSFGGGIALLKSTAWLLTLPALNISFPPPRQTLHIKAWHARVAHLPRAPPSC